MGLIRILTTLSFYYVKEITGGQQNVSIVKLVCAATLERFMCT